MLRCGVASNIATVGNLTLQNNHANSSSKGKLTKYFGVIINGTGESRLCTMGTTNIYDGKAISNKYVCSFFTNDGLNFRRINAIDT